MTTEEEIAAFAINRWGWKPPAEIALKLCEEVGEIAGAIIKIPEGRALSDDLDREIGDALIVLSQLAAKRKRTLESLRDVRFKQIKERAEQQDLFELGSKESAT